MKSLIKCLNINQLNDHTLNDVPEESICDSSVQYTLNETENSVTETNKTQIKATTALADVSNSTGMHLIHAMYNF